MRTDNRRGIAAMTAAMVVFVSSDALMKHASETVPVVQTILVRSVLVAGFLLTIAGVRRDLRFWRAMFSPALLGRGLLDTIGSFGFLIALAHIALPIAIAMGMATPLAVLPFAVLLLGEKVGWRRWTSVAVGFVGVLLVAQPEPGQLNWWALLVFATTFVFALRDVSTRRIEPGVPSILVAAATASVFATSAAIAVAVAGWQPMTSAEAAVLVGAAVFACAGMILLVYATRVGEASVITGFRYTALVWGLVIGYVVWGDLPGTLAWCGIALIVGAGLYAGYRERVRRREAAAAGAPL